MSTRLSSLSTEHIYVPVTAPDGADPTTAVVEMAFKVSGEPEAGDWNAAEWEPGGPPYRIRCLVGPGGEVLADGTYSIWIRIQAAPEDIKRRAGVLVVT